MNKYAAKDMSFNLSGIVALQRFSKIYLLLKLQVLKNFEEFWNKLYVSSH